MNKPLILHTARYTGIPWEILKSVVLEGFEVRTLDELREALSVDVDVIMLDNMDNDTMREAVKIAEKWLKDN